MKANRSIVWLLFLGLACGMFLLPGKTSLADQSGGLARADDDSRGVKHRVIEYPLLDVEVWVDKGEGAVYNPGDNIKIYFQASHDCYVVIYNIDTRGYVELLYPVDDDDDPFVEGGRVYRIPDRFDDYELTVDGPDGVEYIQAVASPGALDLPNFPGQYTYEGEVYAYQLDGEDPFEFMADVNAEIAPYDYASDVCIFSVEYPHPKWYYWPNVVYVDRPVDLYWGGVYFDYPWGVDVWIDGVFYGVTPITIPYLVVGRHYVSFWYRGCWIWRDWCRIRRDYTITIWPDCHERYWYVHENFVEKNYRAEKAKRRRGIGKTAGLVKPVRRVEKGRLAKAEPLRVKKAKELRKESPAKRQELKDRSDSPRPSKAELKRGTDKIKAKSIRKPTPSKRNLSVTESKKAKRIKTEVKAPKKAKRIKTEMKAPKKIKKEAKSVRSEKAPKAPQKISKSGSSKPKSSAARISSSGKTTTKSAGASKAPSGKTSSKSGKRRR
ncbi:MAG: DUF4384 domain-containing protein [Candidatus Zixiibacteriota bacterium]